MRGRVLSGCKMQPRRSPNGALIQGPPLLDRFADPPISANRLRTDQLDNPAEWVCVERNHKMKVIRKWLRRGRHRAARGAEPLPRSELELGLFYVVKAAGGGTSFTGLT